MLVLSRKVGEEVIINDNIRVTVVAIKGDRIRLGFTAPNNVTVNRAEIQDRAQCLSHFVDMQLTAIVGDGASETSVHDLAICNTQRISKVEAGVGV
jgi:carbon storage regulator